jgi:hypothetical protein
MIRRNLRSQSRDYLEDIQTNEDQIYGQNAQHYAQENQVTQPKTI